MELLLKELIAKKDVVGIANFIKTHDLKIENNKVIPNNNEHIKYLRNFWDQRQLIRKILLNSTYGATANPGSRWYDPRVAQSVTLTGRCIAVHMQAKMNEIITGSYDHLGDSIVYGDTDSGYFSAYEVMKDLPEFSDYEWTKENVIDLYDGISEVVNDSFSDYMVDAFNCTKTQGSIIKAGREVCGVRGLFITKKRYAVLVYDNDGKRTDTDGKPGKIKAMGLDLKRSDTPKPVQEFLNEIITRVLTTHTEQDIMNFIVEFRKEFRNWDPWYMGSPKRVNNLTKYRQIRNLQRSANLKGNRIDEKKTIPGHVSASLNWNLLREINDDRYSMEIQDGAKVIVCKLSGNPMGMTSVAYPVDEMQLPEWFKKLPFDRDAMEQSLVDKKIKNLLSVLNWDISDRNDTTFNQLFTF